MIHSINISQAVDPEAVFIVLGNLGYPTWHPDTANRFYVHIDGPETLHDQIHPIPGVLCCCDADMPNSPTLITAVDPGFWNIGAIDGTGDTHYCSNTAGVVCHLDSEPAALIPNVTKVLTLDGPGNHGTGTSDLIRQVYPDCTIIHASIFNANDAGTVAMANAGLNAIGAWLEANPQPRLVPVSCSFQTAAALVYDAAIARINAAGGVVVCSSGNEGLDLGTVDRSPADHPSAITVGAMDQSRRRWQGATSGSSYPAKIYAGGDGCKFRQANGTYLNGQTGTSIACPIVAASIALALDRGHTLDDVLINWPNATVTNLAPGDTSGAILRVPANEVDPAVPPPPDPEIGMAEITLTGSLVTIPVPAGVRSMRAQSGRIDLTSSSADIAVRCLRGGVAVNFNYFRDQIRATTVTIFDSVSITPLTTGNASGGTRRAISFNIEAMNAADERPYLRGAGINSVERYDYLSSAVDPGPVEAIEIVCTAGTMSGTLFVEWA